MSLYVVLAEGLDEGSRTRAVGPFQSEGKAEDRSQVLRAHGYITEVRELESMPDLVREARLR